MKKLMTKHFFKWASKQNLPSGELLKALDEVDQGQFEANLGSYLYKKRIRFQGKGKSGSGRTIICYKKGDRAIFLYGFAKSEKLNLRRKELLLLKGLGKALLKLPIDKLDEAIKIGDFVEAE